MSIFVAGGIYEDDETGEFSFSFLTDESSLLVMALCEDKDDPTTSMNLFTKVRSLGHVYRVSTDCQQVDLEIASEQAESDGIHALKRVDLCQDCQQDLRDSIQEMEGK